MGRRLVRVDRPPRVCGGRAASLRFFPLVPALARALSVLPGLGVGAALVVVANVSALGGTALLAGAGQARERDDELARRAAWLICLAPPAFVMVMGYAEGTLLLLGVGVFWAFRAKRWWWAAALGVLAGTCRPIGGLLAVPALVEGLREWRRAPQAQRGGIVSAVLGPTVGVGAFLGWVGWRYGDALAPLRIQEEASTGGPDSGPVHDLGARRLSFRPRPSSRFRPPPAVGAAPLCSWW